MVVIVGMLGAGAMAAPAGARTIEAERVVLGSSGAATARASALGGRAVLVEAGRPVRLGFPVRALRGLGVRARTADCRAGIGRLLVSAGGVKRPVVTTGAAWSVPSWPAKLEAGDAVVTLSVPGRSCSMLVDKIEVRESVPIGTAMWHRYSQKEARYLPTVIGNFDSITPENEMKMFALQPERGVFDFTEADKIVAFANRNRIAVHGHTLVWTAGIPAWMYARDLFNRPVLSRAELLQVLEVHVKTVVSRYRGRVVSWDVVNEAYLEDGRMRPNIFLEVIGPEYIELAFRWAREADPDAKLFYNETAADVVNPRSDAVLNMVRDFQKRGIPIDGVGFQHHISGDDPQTAAGLRFNLARFGRLGLDVAVSELDVTTKKIKGGEAERERAHAAAFEAAARACELEPRCTRLTVWGVADHLSWLGADERALAFDAEYRPKPAWKAITSVLGRPA